MLQNLYNHYINATKCYNDATKTLADATIHNILYINSLRIMLQNAHNATLNNVAR